MIDSKQLVEYTKHPELALKHLNELLALLESDDETERECASDLLENCGPPSANDVSFLCDQLKSKIAARVYWSSTLLGRIRDSFENSAQRSCVQRALCGTLEDTSLELSARERAVWAIGEIGGIDEACRTTLEKHINSAAPRLKRLLETALAS